LAIDEKAEMLLIAGDLFDVDWKDYNTGLFLVAQLLRLGDAGVRTFMISGNHDAASRITCSLRLPEGVILFSADRAETVVLDDLEVAVHGQGYSSRSIDRDLSAEYPRAIPGRFNIGLLHTSADGQGHETYAPCSVASLTAHGHDYWALGHVHRREVLSRDPWIVFPGNLQGRHARETGAKGAMVVTVEDRSVTGVEHRDLHVVRWETWRVDAGGAATPEAVVDLVSAELEALRRANGDRVLAARPQVTGASAAHETLARDPEHWVNELRAAALGWEGRCGSRKWRPTRPLLRPSGPQEARATYW
jgi:exonuclease SbcD